MHDATALSVRVRLTPGQHTCRLSTPTSPKLPIKAAAAPRQAGPVSLVDVWRRYQVRLASLAEFKVNDHHSRQAFGKQFSSLSGAPGLGQ